MATTAPDSVVRNIPVRAKDSPRPGSRREKAPVLAREHLQPEGPRVFIDRRLSLPWRRRGRPRRRSRPVPAPSTSLTPRGVDGKSNITARVLSFDVEIVGRRPSAKAHLGVHRSKSV